MGNITFYDFCCFWCVAVNLCINLVFNINHDYGYYLLVSSVPEWLGARFSRWHIRSLPTFRRVTCYGISLALFCHSTLLFSCYMFLFQKPSSLISFTRWRACLLHLWDCKHGSMFNVKRHLVLLWTQQCVWCSKACCTSVAEGLYSVFIFPFIILVLLHL